jgi:hypothetical protein
MTAPTAPPNAPADPALVADVRELTHLVDKLLLKTLNLVARKLI